MGLGQLFVTGRSPVRNRVISDFAVIDGVAVDAFGGSAHLYRGGMSVPGAWRSALLLSDLIGSVPWHAYRSVGGRPVELMTPTPPLLDQPAPPDTRMTTFSSLALDLIWEGNAVGLIAARNAEGWPTALVPVPSRSVSVRRDGGAIEYRIGQGTYNTDQVIHIKGPCEPGAVRGVGVLEAHLNTLTLADEQARQARSVSTHGVPTGTLKSDNPDVTEDEARELKAGWLASQRDRTIAVLNSTTSFQPLSWNPEQLQLVEARKFSLHELALIFGLDPSWLGAAQASRVYSNITEDTANLIRFSLGGHLARFEQTLALAFPRGTWVKANLDGLLRATTLPRYQAHQLGIAGGFLTADEARELEDRPPLTAAQKADMAPPVPALPPTVPTPQEGNQP